MSLWGLYCQGVALFSHSEALGPVLNHQLTTGKPKQATVADIL
jgi:hypothetical protein